MRLVPHAAAGVLDRLITAHKAVVITWISSTEINQSIFMTIFLWRERERDGNFSLIVFFLICVSFFPAVF